MEEQVVILNRMAVVGPVKKMTSFQDWGKVREFAVWIYGEEYQAEGRTCAKAFRQEYVC